MAENIFANIFQKMISKIAFFAPGGGSVRPWLQKIRGVQIGNQVWIGQYVYFDELYPEMIKIGDESTIGLRVTIFCHMHWNGRSSNGYCAPVIIGNEVYIGPHCVVLPNVTIGDGSVIRAGTVVSRNVPPHTFWGTDPAGPLGEVTVPLTRKHTYQQFQYGLRSFRKKYDHESPKPPGRL